MEENKEVQSSPEMPEMKNEPSKGKKKGGLLKLIIALVVIGVIAAVVVLGAQGGWFQGSLFRGKVRTVAPISKTIDVVKRDKDKPIEISEDIIKKNEMIEKETIKLDDTIDKIEVNENIFMTNELDEAMIEQEMITKEIDKFEMESIEPDIIKGRLEVVTDSDYVPVEQDEVEPSSPAWLNKVAIVDSIPGFDTLYGVKNSPSYANLIAFKVEVTGDTGYYYLNKLEYSLVDSNNSTSKVCKIIPNPETLSYLNFDNSGNYTLSTRVTENNTPSVGETVSNRVMDASDGLVDKETTRIEAGETKYFVINLGPMVCDSSKETKLLINNIEFVDNKGNKGSATVTQGNFDRTIYWD
jgi:hypothetical protein